ncbi:MAG TPA: hypothetical protein VGB03_02685, partial [Acidimicrobiales bacterium]
MTDPTGSVAVGRGGSDADGSLLAYSDRGCARSGLVAVQYDDLLFDPLEALLFSGGECSGYSADAPVAIATGDARGAVAYGHDSYAGCWNPAGAGCLPTVTNGASDSTG